MRRFVVPVALALLAVACGSDPMLASELDTTTSTTTTTSSAPTTTIMDVTTTTTIDPGPDVSDVLRLAYDDLLDQPSVRYVAYTETLGGPDGDSRVAQTGQWQAGDISELQYFSTSPSGPLSELAVAARPIDDIESELTGASQRLVHRFPDDDQWWSITGDDAPWVRRDPALAGPDLKMWADAATFLNALFTAIVVVEDPVEDDAGNLRYDLVLNAGLVVPVLAGSEEPFIIQGWETPEDLTTTGSLTLGDSGELVGAVVDTGPWWRAGWAATGTAFDEATATWAIALQSGALDDALAVPCSEPTIIPDELFGGNAPSCPA